MDVFRRFFDSSSPSWVVIVTVMGVLIVDYVGAAPDALLWAVTFLGGLPVYIDAALSMARLKMSIDIFNAFALSVALSVGEIHSAAFIVLMLACASLLDRYTSAHTSNAVEELLRLKPRTAIIEKPHEALVEVPIEEVHVGDTILIKSGERVGVDGTLVWGDGLFDESSLTGESRPVRHHKGDEVYASTINIADPVKIKATKVGKDSTLERMAALVASAGRAKSRTERLADKFALYFFPLILVLGAVTYIVGGPLMMVAFFLVACADDVAVALPLAITASIGTAARRGVIVKGGEWFAALARADTLVLDKTGTLTYGAFRVTDVRLSSDVDSRRFWECVAAAEKYSEHPIGHAIAAEALRHAPRAGDPESSEVIRGAGIIARYHQGEIVIGNDALCKGRGLIVPTDSAGNEIGLNGRATTHVHVFLRGVYAGTIDIADRPRENAADALRAMRALGFKRVIMLTGDNEKAAEEVARGIGITEWTSGVTPEAKLDLLDQLADKGCKVVMVGDGINDAPALARAHVGIAMGGIGTAVAVEAANIILLSDDLARIPDIVRLARRTMSVAWGDIWIWFMTNIGGFILVWVGIFGPVLAAIYNLGTDFLPALNSTRLFFGERQKKNR